MILIGGSIFGNWHVGIVIHADICKIDGLARSCILNELEV